jgi:hypothetical protein
VNGKRTKRWQGSVVPKSEGGYIPCSMGGSGTPRHKSAFAYHDWFIANHPPIRVA